MSRPEPAKNVLFIAYWFPPRGGAAVQRSMKFVRYLPTMGYRPLVLTAAGQDARFASDRQLLEEVGEATVFRCPGYERLVVRLPQKLRIHRLVSFWTRPDTNVLAWLPRARRMAGRIAREHPISVIYTSLGPYSSALLGQRLKKQLGVPWVVDYRDPWTTGPFRVYPTRFHYLFEERQERRALEAADAIVVVTPTMRDFVVQNYPQWADKTHVICNGFDQVDIPAAAAPTRDARLRIGFTGTLLDYNVHPVAVGMHCGPLDKLWGTLFSFCRAAADYSTHSPCYLLRAVKALLEERPELLGAIELRFAGIFGEENRKLVRELGLEDVVSVQGYLAHTESVRLLAESDLLFFPLVSPADGQRSHIYTGKLFEYLATGKPILAAVPAGDARDLIERAGAGWCVDPRDVGAIKSLLQRALERKAAGTLAVEPDKQFIGQFERRKLTGQLAELFDSLVG